MGCENVPSPSRFFLGLRIAVRFSSPCPTPPVSYSREVMAAFSRRLAEIHARFPAATASSSLEPLAKLPLPDPLDDDGRYLLALLASHESNVSARHAEATSADRGIPPDLTAFSQLYQRGLTPRECDVLGWITQGKHDAEIAVILGCAAKTVSKHVEHILEKLDAETRLAAAHTALEWLSRST